MEKKINAKISVWTADFKRDIVDAVINVKGGDTNIAEFIYNYKTLVLEATDFKKRQRVKNDVPLHERYRALRANEERCTRRKRDGSKFCGTHAKGIPHGEITDINIEQKTQKKIQVWTEEISGIVRHLDKDGNVYDPVDIYQNINNPRVIAKYEVIGNEYKIIS
jgi:hypothetical protein